MNYDGWVVVGTDMDSKEFDKEIKRLQKESQKFAKEEEKILNKKAKLELDTSKTKQELDSIDRRIKETYSKLESAKVSADTASKYKDREKSLKEVDVLSNKHDSLIEKSAILSEKYDYQVGQMTSLNQKLVENSTNQEMVNSKLDEMKAKSSGLNMNFDNVGKSIMNNIKKVGKWALAIFSVRSAYMMVRQAMSVISTYNDDLNNKLYSIKMMFASALEPLVTRLVSLVWKLMSYVAYIAKAWFGIDLLAQSSANSMKAGTKSAEKMKKTLAGFDEMNVLNDNGTTGASGANTPKFEMPDGKIPDWIKWIADNKDLVLGFFTALGIAFGLLKLSDLIGGFGNLWKVVKPLFDFIGANASIIGGIAMIIGGIVVFVQGIIEYLNDPTWENFGQILLGVGIIAGGVLLIFGGIPALITAIIGIVIALGLAIYKNWDSISQLLGTIGQWIWDYVVMPVINFIHAGLDTIWSIIKLWFSWIEALFTVLINILINPFVIAKDTAIDIFNGIKMIIQGFFNVIKGIFTGDWKTVMNGFKQIFKGTFDSLWAIAKAPLNLIIGGINALIKGANKISFDVPDWVPGFGGKKFGFNIPELKKLKTGGIINLPGRGVPVGYGQAIGGEAGQEGVLPLTDSQQMDLLGQAIARHMTINLTNINQMNGRILSKELKKLDAQQFFATNG